MHIASQATTAPGEAAPEPEFAERIGRYMREHSLQDIRTDIETGMREHPVVTILVGAGVGFLLGKTLSR